MIFITGLGNPEQQYLSTRHNVGWMLMDFLAEKWNFPAFSEQKKFFSHISRKENTFLIKPTTYMNNSGQAVRSFIQFYEPQLFQENEVTFPNVVIAHDDLDIPVGSWKCQFASGPKVHNGINSIRDHLHSNSFWYVRIGVDGREGQRTIPGKDYVLQSFTPDEKEQLKKVFEEITTRLISEFSLRF